MELTKEYFEHHLAQQFELFEARMDKKLDQKLEEKLEAKLEEKLEAKFTEKLKDMATKQDLADQTRELKSYVHESFEAQQVYIDERFSELTGKLSFELKI